MTLDELANRLDDGVNALEQIARLLDRLIDEWIAFREPKEGEDAD